MTKPTTPLEIGLPVFERVASSNWRLRTEAWHQAATRATDWIVHPKHIPKAALFKRGPRRLVFRLDSVHPEHPAVMVKAFPLNTLRHRWRHKKYGQAETINLLIAEQRGLPVPRVFAHGWRRQWGLVCWNTLVMEFIDGRPLKEHLTQASGSTNRELLWRVLPLFEQVYQTGCNHIDLGPHAILLGQSTQRDRLIDFQYCRFLDAPAPATFAAQAGYFGWCLTTHWNLVPRELVLEWFQAILGRLSLENRSGLENIFQQHLVHKASIRERLEN